MEGEIITPRVMKDFIPLGVGVGITLLLAALWLAWYALGRVRELSRTVKRLRQDIDIAEAKVQQTQFIDLDLSSIETKIEEKNGELQLYVEQEVASLSRELEDIDERLETLEADRDNTDEERIIELEERVAEFEERLQIIETKKL